MKIRTILRWCSGLQKKKVHRPPMPPPRQYGGWPPKIAVPHDAKHPFNFAREND